jgi:intracellular septation protein
MAKAVPPYFLLSFIPAAAYWALETYSTLEVALMGGILLGVLEMGLEKKITGHVHSLSKMNLTLIVVLGSVALLANQGIWFKLQPTFTGIALAAVVLFKKFTGKSLMLDMLSDLKQRPPLPPEAYHLLEWHLAIFLIVFAGFMAQVAVYQSTANWLFWKTGGFYIAFGAFMMIEIIYLRFHLRRKQ